MPPTAASAIHGGDVVDRATGPIVIGQDVEILSVAGANGRQELIATCERAGRHHQIALLDIHVKTDQPPSHLLNAYRRWTGTESPGT